MATTEKLRLTDPAGEVDQAKGMAARYRCEFVDLREASIGINDPQGIVRAEV